MDVQGLHDRGHPRPHCEVPHIPTLEKNLSDDKDLVNYFRKVIDIREKLEEKRNNL